MPKSICGFTNAPREKLLGPDQYVMLMLLLFPLVSRAQHSQRKSFVSFRCRKSVTARDGFVQSERKKKKVSLACSRFHHCCDKQSCINMLHGYFAEGRHRRRAQSRSRMDLSPKGEGKGLLIDSRRSEMVRNLRFRASRRERNHHASSNDIAD